MEDKRVKQQITMKRIGGKIRKHIFSDDKKPWSDLPYELLEIIKKRLFFADQVNFRAVCKSWSCIRRVPPLQQMPWLLVFDNNNIVDSCKLIDSKYKKIYTINAKVIIDKLKMKKLKPQVHESKYGWLLISCYQLPYSTPEKIFLYSPFLDEKNNFIDLPILSSIISLATFTSNPLDDGDCTVLALCTNDRDNTLQISTYHCGQSSWNSRVFKCEFSLLEVKCWMYSEGIFYYLTVNSTVGEFDFAREAWNVFPSLPIAISTFRLHYHMVKSDGELFLMLEGNLSEPIYHSWRYVGHIYRLDLSSMIWEDLDSIGDRVLFIGNGYNSVLNASVLKFNGERKGMSDKIYYSSYYKLKYCTVHDYTLRDCDNGKPRKLDCSRHYGSIAKKVNLTKVLIDPPPR